MMSRRRGRKTNRRRNRASRRRLLNDTAYAIKIMSNRYARR